MGAWRRSQTACGLTDSQGRPHGAWCPTARHGAGGLSWLLSPRCTTTCGSQGFRNPCSHCHTRPPSGQMLSSKFLRFGLQPPCRALPGGGLLLTGRAETPSRDLSAALTPAPRPDFPVRPSPGPLGPQPRGQVLGPEARGRGWIQGSVFGPPNRSPVAGSTSPQGLWSGPLLNAQ